ncbi:MAG: ABC transporter permease [Candidatus Aminicenantes bacterium]|nr:ABC transporter permease [Candidatus Aminicenantes bacterium]
MIGRALKAAVRNARRHKTASFINIAGMAVGLACALLIFLWVSDERSVDGFHANGNEICRVLQRVSYSGRELTVAVTPGPLGPALQAEIPEIVQACRLRRVEMKFALGERWLTESAALADASFLEMFSFPLIQGDPAGALADPRSIVLSEDMARKYFPAGEALGRTLRAEGRIEFRVGGVMRTPPRNSILRTDFVIPFAFARELGFPIDAWDDSRFTTFVQMGKGAPPAAVAGKISEYLSDKPTLGQGGTLDLQPLRAIYLHPGLAGEPFSLGDIRAVRVFSLAALFILLIACVNFMNLTTASSARRAREVGVRKVSGAVRGQLIGQFYGESLLLTAVSFAAAVGLAALLLPLFNTIAAKELTFGLLASSGPAALVAGFVALTGLLAGSYPALFLSKFQPAKVLKGELSLGARGRAFRRVLCVFQFSLSILLLVATVFVRDQLVFMRSHQTGYDKEQVLTIAMGEETRARFEAIREELLRHPDVLGAAAAANVPTRGYMYSNSLWDWPGKNPREEILMRGTCADVGYFGLLGMEILRGRDFVESADIDTNIQWIINEEAARVMGLEDPVGRPLTQGGEFKGTIVGVVKDYHFTALKERIDPLVIGYNPPLSRFLFAKVRPGNVSGALRAIEEVWRKLAPQDEFRYRFLVDAVDALYRSEERIGAVLLAFSALSMLVACLGLFGLASFLAEQRTKEIGIRRVLGASTARVILQFSREFVWGLAAANAIAWPAGFYFVQKWLRGYAYRITVGPGPFLFAAGLTLTVALLTVGFRFSRAASARPAKILKHE